MGLEIMDTYQYMIAGYAVIFSFILGYLIRLFIRIRRVERKISVYREMLDERL